MDHLLYYSNFRVDDFNFRFVLFIWSNIYFNNPFEVSPFYIKFIQILIHWTDMKELPYVRK